MPHSKENRWVKADIFNRIAEVKGQMFNFLSDWTDQCDV